MKRGGKISILK